MSRLEEIRRYCVEAKMGPHKYLTVRLDDLDWLLSRVDGLVKAGKKVFTCYSGPDSLEQFLEAVRGLETELRKAQE